MRLLDGLCNLRPADIRDMCDDIAARRVYHIEGCPIGALRPVPGDVAARFKQSGIRQK